MTESMPQLSSDRQNVEIRRVWSRPESDDTKTLKFDATRCRSSMYFGLSQPFCYKKHLYIMIDFLKDSQFALPLLNALTSFCYNWELVHLCRIGLATAICLHIFKGLSLIKNLSWCLICRASYQIQAVSTAIYHNYLMRKFLTHLNWWILWPETG